MPFFSLKVTVPLLRARDLVPMRSVGGGKKGVGLMEGVSAVEISVVGDLPYDFNRGSFKGGGGAAKTGLGIVPVLGVRALDRVGPVGTMVWGERGVGGKYISASSSRVGRLEKPGSCFGVEGEVGPESYSQSELGSPAVHIVDRD
jgi:hypothetical protein